MSLEKTILKHLITNEEYSRKVLPFLEEDYFTEPKEKALFSEIKKFVLKYNTMPTTEALLINLDEVTDGVSDSEIEASKKILTEFDLTTKVDEKWLIDNTEQFCQDKAIYLAMTKAIEIMNQKNGKMQKGAIPQLLSDALAISFDPNIGHDYLLQADERFDFYHKLDEKIAFDLAYFNKITANGLSKKTLNVAIAGVHVGKTLFMTHCAAAHLKMGKNVLYITLEMAEEKISERIDANLMNINIADIKSMPKDTFDKKVAQIKSKTDGQLIVKEYPTTTASALHFEALLNELRLKKKFVPDIVYIDYLNLVASSRYRSGKTGMYEYIKGVAEELRGFAVKNNIPVMTATQLNRTGFTSSDVGMEHTAESFGLPATADFMFAMIADEALKKLDQIMIIQLKNRYGDIGLYTKFMIGVDRAKMRLYDVENSAQTDLVEANNPDVAPPPSSNPKDKFKGLKV